MHACCATGTSTHWKEAAGWLIMPQQRTSSQQRTSKPKDHSQQPTKRCRKPHNHNQQPTRPKTTMPSASSATCSAHLLQLVAGEAVLARQTHCRPKHGRRQMPQQARINCNGNTRHTPLQGHITKARRHTACVQDSRGSVFPTTKRKGLLRVVVAEAGSGTVRRQTHGKRQAATA